MECNNKSKGTKIPTFLSGKFVSTNCVFLNVFLQSDWSHICLILAYKLMYNFPRNINFQCLAISGDWKLEYPAIIALRPEAPIEKQFLDLPASLLAHIEALVAHLREVKHWRSTIQHPQKHLLPLLFDALTIGVVQVVFLAVILRVVFNMAGLGDFDLIRVPALLGGVKLNLDMTTFHLKTG